MNRYVVSDLHGQLDLLNQISEYIGANDTLYILGDSGDRGPHPWKTLKASLDDPRFIYLMGNHDLLLIQAIEEYYDFLKTEGRCDITIRSYKSRGALPLLRINGGLDTIIGWAAELEREKYYKKLKQLPLEIRLAALDERHMIYLTHAGYTPSIMGPHTVKELLWDRGHFIDEWYRNEGNIVIHGHTPINFLIRRLESQGLSYDCTNGYCVYCGGSKICIDMGAHDTNQTVLLNLDTFESKIFSIKEDVNGAKKN